MNSDASASPDGPDEAADLVELVGRNGSRTAFVKLFRQFGPLVKAYGLKAGMSQAGAEDLVQDVMLALWRNAGRFDRSRARVSTWVFTIARNRRIDLLRRQRRPEPDPEDPAFNPGPEPDAFDKVADRHDADRLASALATLPEAQRELMVKAYFEDKSHGEIAAEMDLPLGTVKSRLRLALGRMRQQIEPEAD